MPEQPRSSVNHNAKDDKQNDRPGLDQKSNLRSEARQQRIRERVERANAIMTDIRSRMTDEEYDAQLNAYFEQVER